MNNMILVGVNVVANVRNAMNNMRNFGRSFQTTYQTMNRQATQFSNSYARTTQRIHTTNRTMTRALAEDWRVALNRVNGDTKRLASAYDRRMRDLGNQFQSMIMGSVALSMSGIGIQNAGLGLLTSMKPALDAARDWELVMKQIQFYGKLTADELSKAEQHMFKLGRDLPVTSNEIANSVMSAFKLGYDTIGQAQTMAEEASKINFMSLGKLDGDESMKYLNQFRKLSGYAVKDVSKLTDMLTKTSDLSAASLDSLWKTIQSSRSAMDNLGLDAENMLTIAGVMTDRLQPRAAGQALSSFGRGVQMAEKAGREDRGQRGADYNELKQAMGGMGFDDFKGDVLSYIQNVATKSREIWGEGSARTGRLISIFGGSAIDLFHAYDAYNKQSGRTMTEMRDGIKESAGYSKEFMDTIMGTSYGTEQMLQAVTEQFQILFGKTIRPAFNQILQVITKVITKVNEFIEAHPRLAKALGYGAGIAGALMVASGAIMIFGGAMLAIYASLNNFILQLARQTNVVRMLSMGYNTAGQMIKAQFLGPLGMIGKLMLRLTAWTFFLSMAWKYDFLRMRTVFNEWKDNVKKGLEESKGLWEHYRNSSSHLLDQSFAVNTTTPEGKIANFITKARMLWDGLKDIWSDGFLEGDKKQKLDDAGLLGIVEFVYQAKTAVLEFWKGFTRGLKDGIEVFWDFIKPLRTAFSWLRDKFIEIMSHFGYFQNINNGVSNKWQEWGEKLGVIVGMAVGIKLALWAWVGAFKLLGAPLKLAWGMLKGIFGLVKAIGGFGLFTNIAQAFRGATGNIFTRIFKGLGVGFVKTIANSFMKFLPGPIRKLVGFMVNPFKNLLNRPHQTPGARSVLQNRAPVIDPATGRQRVDRHGNPMYQATNQRGSRGGPTIIPGNNRSSQRRTGRGLLGRTRDMLFGREYEPETARNGRRYIRNEHGGVTWLDANGQTAGRNGRRVNPRTNRGLLGSQRWRSIREILRGQGGYIGGTPENRPNGATPRTQLARQMANGPTTSPNNPRPGGNGRLLSLGDGNGSNRNTTATNSPRPGGPTTRGPGQGGRFLMRGDLQRFGADAPTQQRTTRAPRAPRGGRLGRIGNVFSSLTKGIGKVAGGLGKGLLKGIGGVVTKGIPMLFKGALKLIPILGWALMAWEIISMIWSNWGAIEKAGKWVWDKIKQFGLWAWEGIKSLAGIVWGWISTKAQSVWNAVLAWGVSIFTNIGEWAKGVWSAIQTKASNVWEAVKTYGINMWNNIKAFAGTVWEGIKAFGMGVWNFIVSYATAKWNLIKGIALSVWDGIKTFAVGVWNGLVGVASGVWGIIKSIATGKWDEIKGYASQVWEGLKDILSAPFKGLLATFQGVWDSILTYAKNNPVTQTINKVTNWVSEKLGGGKEPGHRTGLWTVPRENYLANLHQGEMVLTRQQAMLLRNGVGNGTIEDYLLERSNPAEDLPTKTVNKPILPTQSLQTIKVQSDTPKVIQGGNTTTVTIQEGAFKVEMKSGNANEIKKVGKELFNEFKRLIEIENMRNYKPARAR
jgi:TP901 family phage tail tape measure protein